MTMVFLVLLNGRPIMSFDYEGSPYRIFATWDAAKDYCDTFDWKDDTMEVLPCPVLTTHQINDLIA